MQTRQEMIAKMMVALSTLVIIGLLLTALHGIRDARDEVAEVRLWEVKPADVAMQLKAVEELIINGVDDRFRRSDHENFVDELMEKNPELIRPNGY